MKIFLSYSAIIEGLTGLGLMVFPSVVVNLLLNATLIEPVAIILSLISGVAIFSIALVSWLLRTQPASLIAVKVLLFYNLAISVLLVYGISKFGFTGFAVWIVILFHVVQSIVSLVLISKKTVKATQ